jgi:hypothetical protein
MSLIGFTLSATTWALYRLLRSHNELVAVTGGYMAITSMLASITFMLTSSRGKLHVVLTGARPFITSDLVQAVRWFFLEPSYRAVAMEISRLIQLRLRRRERIKLASAASVAAGGDAVAAAAAGQRAAREASPLDDNRAYFLCDYSSWHPRNDWLIVALAVLGSIVSRVSVGGWQGCAPVLMSVVVALPYFSPRLVDSSVLRARLMPWRAPRPSGGTAGGGSGGDGGSVGCDAAGGGGVGCDAAGATSGAATAAATADDDGPDSPAKHYYEQLDRYSGFLSAIKTINFTGAAVVITSELVKALAPLSPLGVRVAVAAEAVQLLGKCGRAGLGWGMRRPRSRSLAWVGARARVG